MLLSTLRISALPCGWLVAAATRRNKERKAKDHLLYIFILCLRTLGFSRNRRTQIVSDGQGWLARMNPHGPTRYSTKMSDKWIVVACHFSRTELRLKLLALPIINSQFYWIFATRKVLKRSARWKHKIVPHYIWHNLPPLQLFNSLTNWFKKVSCIILHVQLQNNVKYGEITNRITFLEGFLYTVIIKSISFKAKLLSPHLF